MAFKFIHGSGLYVRLQEISSCLAWATNYVRESTGRSIIILRVCEFIYVLYSFADYVHLMLFFKKNDHISDHRDGVKRGRRMLNVKRFTMKSIKLFKTQIVNN